MSAMMPISKAKAGQYVLAYHNRKTWHDSESDPNYVVVKLTEVSKNDCRYPLKLWVTFGSTNFDYDEIVGWWPLPMVQA